MPQLHKLTVLPFQRLRCTYALLCSGAGAKSLIHLYRAGAKSLRHLYRYIMPSTCCCTPLQHNYTRRAMHSKVCHILVRGWHSSLQWIGCSHSQPAPGSHRYMSVFEGMTRTSIWQSACAEMKTRYAKNTKQWMRSQRYKNVASIIVYKTFLLTKLMIFSSLSTTLEKSCTA